jgi:hypothetical protein
MRPLIAILLLLATPALGHEIFPSDYKPAPCADPAKVCKSFPQSQIAEIAGLRGFDIGQEWVDAHWNELAAALAPMCAKMATCFATPGNDFVFCNDVLALQAKSLCDRYPAGSKDREKCSFFLPTYLAGIDRNSREPWTEMQACAAKQAPAGERTFEHWMEQGDGFFTVYAIDSETRVPVRALLHIQSAKPIHAEDVPDGRPTTFYKTPWKPQLVRVANADGHRDVVPPVVRIEAPGYRTESFSMPVAVPKMIVEMNPPLRKLRRGKNRVTITARDATTGAPVEARVMGGEHVLGKTNVPFELEWRKGQKRPEIWITNLYDRYSDVVVAPAEK